MTWLVALVAIALTVVGVSVGIEGDPDRAAAQGPQDGASALAVQTAVRTFRIRRDFPDPPPGKLIFPADPAGYCSLWTGSYGSSHSIRPGGHEGTDIMLPGGNMVFAVESGVLTKRYTGTGTSGSGYGWTLTGDSGTQYKFFHLRTDDLGRREGARVERGDVIGYVGDTGTIAGNYHLHLEVRPNGSHVDPLPLLDIPSSCRVS